MSQEASAIVVPFGKHKGSTVAELLAHDPQYAERLAAIRGWIGEDLKEATQDLKRHRDTWQPWSWSATPVGEYRTRWADGRTYAGPPTQEERAKERQLEAKVAEIEATIAQPVLFDFRSRVEFERHGVDVILFWDLVPHGKEDPHSWAHHAALEIKPSLGDDFPTVMRQMERLKADLLVVERFAGRAVPLETVRQMFAANTRKLITVQEIEAEVATARAWLAEPSS